MFSDKLNRSQFFYVCLFPTLMKIRSMKNIYLSLAIVGFLIPNYFVFLESLETGNIMLYLHPIETIKQMFVNGVTTVFISDLLLAVLTYFVFSFQNRSILGTRNLLLLMLATMFFGLAFTFPLTLWLVEKGKRSS